MSKKTIAFQVPRKEPTRPPSRDLQGVPAKVIEAEHWVSRAEPVAEPFRETAGETFGAPKGAPRAATITLTIPADPDWFEAVRIGLFLPSMVFWLWGLAATQKSFQLLAR